MRNLLFWFDHARGVLVDGPVHRRRLGRERRPLDGQHRRDEAVVGRVETWRLVVGRVRVSAPPVDVSRTVEGVPRGLR
jgi:hypothetical protein